MSKGLTNFRRRELGSFLNNSLDDLFSDFWKMVEWPDFALANKSNYPRVNVKEEKDKFVIEAAIPGLTKDDVTVQYEHGLLSISGKSSNNSERNENGYLVRELHRSSFARSFRFDHSKVLPEKIEAKVDNGVLSITIPRVVEDVVEAENVKKIDIK